MWLEVSKRLMGNCISFSLAFPATKFYIREMAAGIAKASNGGEVNLSSVLVGKEIVFGGSWIAGTRRLGRGVSVTSPSLLHRTRRLPGGQRLLASLLEPFLLGTTGGGTKGTSI